ncbi:MAG: hypothetical protein IKI65_05295 [Firmicutes bacterium]|nr:hypothetical protein [Bacillota bacterium]
MSVKEYADAADIIIAGYAYLKKDGYVEVVDLNNLDNRAVIQNDDVIESLMTDEEDDIVLNYYLNNKEFLEDAEVA